MKRFDSWRFRAVEGGKVVEHEGEAGFDELAIGRWLHIECMDKQTYWMQVGDARIVVRLARKGRGVDVERGFYGEVVGETRVPGEDS